MASVVQPSGSSKPGPVTLDQANPVPKSLPPLRAAIVSDGRFIRFAEMPDPRVGFCRAFNGLDLAEQAVPWPESAGEVFGVDGEPVSPPATEPSEPAAPEFCQIDWGPHVDRFGAMLGPFDEAEIRRKGEVARQLTEATGGKLHVTFSPACSDEDNEQCFAYHAMVQISDEDAIYLDDREQMPLAEQLVEELERVSGLYLDLAREVAAAIAPTVDVPAVPHDVYLIDPAGAQPDELAFHAESRRAADAWIAEWERDPLGMKAVARPTPAELPTLDPSMSHVVVLRTKDDRPAVRSFLTVGDARRIATEANQELATKNWSEAYRAVVVPAAGSVPGRV